MKLDFKTILELFFPPSQDEKNISDCTVEAFVRKLSSMEKNGVISLLSFTDTQVRSAIHLNKFHYHPHAQKILQGVLSAWITTLPKKEYLLIPIPLSSKRERERGFNQVVILTKSLHTQFSYVTTDTSILKKVRHTPAQTSLGKRERLLNIKNAYRVIPTTAQSLRDKHIILLDDVTTTGATLAEAKAALLLQYPASILCVALAH